MKLNLIPTYIEYLNTPFIEHEKFQYISNLLIKIISFFDEVDNTIIAPLAKTYVNYFTKMEDQCIKELNKNQLEIFIQNMLFITYTFKSLQNHASLEVFPI